MGQLKGGVRAAIQLRGAGQESRGTARPDIRFKNSVGIVEVAQDQIEIREVVAEIEWELGVRGEEPGERSGIQRANRIGVKAFMRQSDDVRNAENLKVRGRKPVPQQFDRRQREDEVANGAAADNEDPI